MADMVRSKMFKTGGSVAVRIPVGWLDPTVEVTLHRNRHTGRVTISQDLSHEPDTFFDFLRGAEHLPDPGLGELSRREEGPRPGPGE